MNMTLQLNCQLTLDQFNKSNSALAISHGYATVPASVYFNPETGGFTIMVWVKLSSINQNRRIIEFGNGGSSSDNMFFFFNVNSTKPRFVYFFVI